MVSTSAWVQREIWQPHTRQAMVGLVAGLKARKGPTPISVPFEIDSQDRQAVWTEDGRYGKARKTIVQRLIERHSL